MNIFNVEKALTFIMLSLVDHLLVWECSIVKFESPTLMHALICVFVCLLGRGGWER